MANQTHTKHTRKPAKRAAATIRKRIGRGKARFLKELRKCSSVLLAAERARIGRKTVYEWRDADPQFAEHWDDALEMAREDVKVSVHEEAVRKDGNTTLKIFATKAYFPEFRDKAQLENDPVLKRHYLAFAQVMREFVAKERLRDAIIRLCDLSGFDPGTDPGLRARLVGNGSAGTGDHQGNAGDSEKGPDTPVLAVDERGKPLD